MSISITTQILYKVKHQLEEPERAFYVDVSVQIPSDNQQGEIKTVAEINTFSFDSMESALDAAIAKLDSLGKELYETKRTLMNMSFSECARRDPA